MLEIILTRLKTACNVYENIQNVLVIYWKVSEGYRFRTVNLIVVLIIWSAPILTLIMHCQQKVI
jgi:hypothetical protein